MVCIGVKISPRLNGFYFIYFFRENTLESVLSARVLIPAKITADTLAGGVVLLCWPFIACRGGSQNNETTAAAKLAEEDEVEWGDRQGMSVGGHLLTRRQIPHNS